MLTEITMPLGALLTNAGVSQSTTSFVTTLIGAVPTVLQTGQAITQALAPSLDALRQIAGTGREPTEEEFSALRASINAHVRRLAETVVEVPSDVEQRPG